MARSCVFDDSIETAPPFRSAKLFINEHSAQRSVDVLLPRIVPPSFVTDHLDTTKCKATRSEFSRLMAPPNVEVPRLIKTFVT